ncbi:MAG: hypothetical protein ACRBC3_04315 [Burkholderiaceae bacterium]
MISARPVKLIAAMITAFGLCQPAIAQDPKPASAGFASHLAQSPADPTLEKAEINYRARRLTAAMEQFGMIAALHDHPFAWLRVGNILHRRGDVVGALDAYQRAQRAARQADRFAQLGARALMNLALLGLDQAQLALEAFGNVDAPRATSPWVKEVQTRLSELTAALPAKPVDHQGAVANASQAGGGLTGSLR